MITITLPDGSKLKQEKGKTSLDAAKGIGARLAKDALAVKVDGELKDLNSELAKDCSLKILTFSDEEGKKVFWHTAAHVMAHAITRLFPKAKLTIGPTWENGFYYDIAAEPFKPEDLEKIEKEMKKIVAENLPITRKVVKREEAKNLFKGNKYKLEILEEEAKGKEISLYTQGSFTDLCQGPHLPSTGYVKAFKLTKVSGVYWRGDAKNDQLQRIYGVAFPAEKPLKEYLTMIEEAEKRDHRLLGKKLDLFSFHDEASGMPFFHPKGMIIVNELMNFWRAEHIKAGYDEVRTPIILSKSLWEQSGHWDHYKDNMYFTKIDGKDYAVKPMNCPGGMLIYREKVHSYREFPLRVAEVGIVHRHELSGVLSGLFRVRSFTQDDAHIFMTPDQIDSEVSRLIDFIDYFYKNFGFEYHVELSTKPDKAMGDPKLWKQAEDALNRVLKEKGINYKLNPGDGAFYGPKIDFHIKDCIGRTWQCATIQLDFQMPEKFDLTYEGADGKKHRPAILHRVVYGAIERFFGILVEHYAGKFPLWLSPVQVRILTVADRFNDYGRQVEKEYSAKGIRVEVDERTESVSYKVRQAELDKINYIIVVGEKEIKSKGVTVRTRDNKILGEMKKEAFLERLLKEIDEKK
ncbi:threonine--tRNA ligase [Candidatus Woesearchaeota archaeon]|nr:threonine--tRNA ligase [Candidatus Woesearchaeota archaeon]